MITRPSREFRQFLSRAFLPLLLLLFAVSIGANVFLQRMVARMGRSLTAGAMVDPTLSVQEPGVATPGPPRAFGIIERWIPVRPQPRTGSGFSLAAVQRYELPDSVLPLLPEAALLFRDDGVRGDDLLSVFLRRIGAPRSLLNERFGLTDVALETPDGQFTLTLRTADRSMVLRRANPSPPRPADATALSDGDVIQLAQALATTIGQDTAALEPPVIVPQTGGKVSVRWPLRFSGAYVLNPDGTSVSYLSIVIDRGSAEAVALTMRLLSPDVLTASLYPVAGREALVDSFGKGGVLPLAASEPQEGQGDATFSATERVFILLPSDREHPTYVVPALRASWSSPQTCEGCAPIVLSTYVPLIRQPEFLWQEPASPPPV